MIVSEVRSKVCYTKNSDLKVVNAARVSFNKEVTEFTEGDEKLIRYLATHKHWTPFSHCRETYAFKFEAHHIASFLCEFDQASLASAVWSWGAGLDMIGAFQMRHSLYGWANMINKAGTSLPRDYINVFKHVYDDLVVKYPVSMKYLVEDHVHEIYATYAVNNSYFAPVDHDELSKKPDFKDITMIETVPIFVARQRFKHMIGTTYNEVSRRYVSTAPDMYQPDVWRGKAENKKQGSLDTPVGFMYREQHDPNYGTCTPDKMWEIWTEKTVDAYLSLIKDGVCPEQARMNLPQSMMTEYYVTANLSAWNRMIEQRIDPHAQKEIRDLGYLAKSNLTTYLLQAVEGTY